MIIDVHCCQRCGKDHSRLQFRKFTNPVTEYEWWAMCPEIDEPILLKVEKVILTD